MLHIIVQYYNDSNPKRQAEIDACFQRNLECPWVTKLHNLVEPYTVVPEWLELHPKYVEHRLESRLTYADAIAYGNAQLQGQFICLMNADTFVDAESPWFQIRDISANVVLCQTRHELRESGTLEMESDYQQTWGRNTQDAWVWKSPIVVPNTEFELGRLGCDNAIAHRFKSAGYVTVNRGSQLKIGHIDTCRGKSAAGTCTFHASREKTKAFRPASEGWAFVPDLHLAPKLETLLENVQLSPLHNYMMASELISSLWEPEPEVLGRSEDNSSAERLDAGREPLSA